jgi:hypothetical protein
VTINGAADPCGGPGSGRAVLTSLPPVTNVELGVPQPDPDDPLLDAPGEIPLTWAGVDAMFDVPDVPVREYALWLAACYERDVYYAATDLYLQVLAAPNTAIARATAHASPTDLTSFVVVVLAALIGVLTVIQRGRPHLP